MVPKMLRLASFGVLALALAACQVSVIPYNPIIAGTVDAQDTTAPTAVRSNVVLGAGLSLIYDVRVPDARDLLYGEADGSGLRVRWLDRLGFTLAASQSPSWFVASNAELSGSGAALAAVETAELGPRAIDVSFPCYGPCAAIAPSAGRYYLEVRNESSVQQAFDLLVYTFDANDLNDRGNSSNQTAATATPFGASDTPSGAIELVGDQDWFQYTGSIDRTLRFSVQDEAVGLVLEFEDGFMLEGTTAGLTTTVRPNERFRVFSELGRAGPSATSRYTIALP